MAEALRDQNYRTVAEGISSTDSVTPLMFRVDPVTNYLLVTAITDSLTVVPATMDMRDQNFVPTCYGVSSVDGVTPIPIRTDSSGNLLIQFT